MERPGFQMPFPCQQRWEGSTRPTHSPSAYSVDWNRDSSDLGRPVVASAGGLVTSVVNLGDRSYGLYVVVDHGGGWSTLYAHLQRAYVVVGQRVDQGQLIALLGNSGGSSGPHLHYEQRLDRVDRHAFFDERRFEYGSWLRSRACVDVPVAGDWNGDRATDLGAFSRAALTGAFKQRLPGAERIVTTFGRPTDEPVVGDWDGDGQSDLGVRNPMTGAFALERARGVGRFAFGNADDVPVSGDWDGDGRWDVGVYDTRSRVFFLRDRSGHFSTRYFASPGLPVTGDWDGDGRWDVGVYDQGAGRFLLRRPDGTIRSIRLGTATSLPVVGDWNGDAVSDVGVWETTTGVFTKRFKATRLQTVRFGRSR